MKKLFLMILVCFSFFAVSCENQNTQTLEPPSPAMLVETNFKTSELSDETLKALLVIYQTNIKNGFISINNEYSKPSSRIIELSNQVKNEYLSNKECIFVESKEPQFVLWTKDILKTDILKFLINKNISISSISNIKHQTNENGETESLSIGGKIIPFEEIKKQFNLKSNKINNIQINGNTVTITGKEENQKNIFNIKTAETQSKSGFSYKELLENQLKFFN